MARQIVGEFVKSDEYLQKIWPAPTLAGDTIQSHGPDGIADPLLNRELWDVAAQIMHSDRRNESRDPEQIARLRTILGTAGYAGVLIDSDAA